MGDDHEPARGGKPRQGQADEPRVPWLALGFLALTLIALGLGIWFKGHAGSAAESPALTSPTRQTVGIYVDQTGATVHLTAGITWHVKQPGRAEEALYAAVQGANPDTKVLFTSTIRPSSIDLSKPSSVYLGRKLVRASPEWTWSVTVAHLDSISGPYGSPVAEFPLPQVAQVSGGNVFVHLPALAPNVSPFPSTPVEMTEQASPSAPIQDVVTSPALLDQAEPGSIASYSSASYLGTPAGGSSRVLYYQPQTLMTTETINALRPYLQNAVIDSNLPGTGTLQGGTYVWQATGWLEGYLSATEVRTSSAEANYDFYAGLAFASAVGLAVAFIQELKDSTRRSARS
jgi:hypothetical protein